MSTGAIADLPALEGANAEVLLLEPRGTILEIPAAVTLDAGFVNATAEQTVHVHQLVEVDGVAWVRLESARGADGSVTTAVDRLAPIAVVVSDPAAGGSIAGTIAWGSGEPASGAPIALMQGETEVATTTADAAGAFSFTGLASGSYALVVNYECMINQGVSVTEGGTSEVSLTLCGGG